MAELEVEGPINDLLMLPDGCALLVHNDTITAMALDGTVRWQCEGGRRKEPWQPPVFLARLTSDGSLVVAYRDGFLALHDSDTGAIGNRYSPTKNDLIHGCVALASAPMTGRVAPSPSSLAPKGPRGS